MSTPLVPIALGLGLIGCPASGKTTTSTDGNGTEALELARRARSFLTERW
jgi:hypothetical protein